MGATRASGRPIHRHLHGQRIGSGPACDRVGRAASVSVASCRESNGEHIHHRENDMLALYLRARNRVEELVGGEEGQGLTEYA
jgi:hypothetical protein